MSRGRAAVSSSLRVGEPEIEVRLRRSRQARRMVLRVARCGQGPTLTLPPGVPESAAVAFLRDHEGWLRRHMAAAPAPVPVRAGLILPLGDARIALISGTGRLRLEGSCLVVPGPARALPGRVAGFLREQARTACAAGVERDAGQLGRSPGRITLRDPRSRWGSCTSAGDLMFSWRLVMAPRKVLDYVIAHEVAHLAELNHSDRFWATVANLAPGYEAPRAWLRQNGAGLHAYDFKVA